MNDARERESSGLSSGADYDIFATIISLGNLYLSWKKFKKGKMGKSDAQEFALNLEDNLFTLHAELKNKTYRHDHYTSFFVNDPKRRHIHKATVRDRIVHHALYRALYPLFDRGFIYDSYSCRDNKGTHRAVERLATFARQASRNYTRPCFVLKCDTRRFFDSIDHTILLELIGKKVKDADTLWLIEDIIASFRVETEQCSV